MNPNLLCNSLQGKNISLYIEKRFVKLFAINFMRKPSIFISLSKVAVRKDSCERREGDGYEYTVSHLFHSPCGTEQENRRHLTLR